MDIDNLSSNWKSLQAKLAQDAPSKSTKRKASPIESSISSHHHKRPKKSLRHSKDKRSTTMSDESRKLVNSTTDPAPASTQADLSVYENQGLSPTAVLGKYIALDCEMVGVGPTPDDDSQVARVSLVNYHGEQIYDSYVKPKLPVTDYRTRFSGIRPANLAVGRPYSEVRKDVMEMVEGRVLVGHFLKADMKVLELKHPMRDIRDSSRVAKFRDMMGGKNPKLKDLAKKILGLDIQTGEHNSVEDARAAMLIYKAEKEAYESEVRKMFPQAVPKIRGGPPKKKNKRGKKTKS